MLLSGLNEAYGWKKKGRSVGNEEGGQIAGEASVGALLCWLFVGLGGGKDGGELVLGDLRLSEVVNCYLLIIYSGHSN